MTTGIASGVGGFFAYQAESTYGTFVPPTHSVIANSSSLARNPTFVQGSGFANGQLLDPVTRRLTAMADANGTVNLDVPTNQIGLLLKMLMGTATNAQQGATTAWLETFTFTDTLGLFFSGQMGIPDALGTLHAYNFQGGKVTQAEFSCAKGDKLTAAIDMDFQGVQETSALIVPSYVEGGGIFAFEMESLLIGALGSEASIQGVTDVDLTIARNMNTQRFYANNGGLKSEPVTNAKAGVTGSIGADLVTKADLYDRFAADSTFSLIWKFTSPVLAGVAFPYAITFNLPVCRFDNTTPTVDGLDVVNGTLPFTVLTDSTPHLPSITLMTTDTTP